ncbi:MAG: hypothetical protein U0133_08105 [Gemmatimonadales bacterium]
MDSPELHREVAAELRRLGLDNGPSGLFAAWLADVAGLLARLRSLPVGACWADVFPGPEPVRPRVPQPARVPPPPAPLVRPFALEPSRPPAPVSSRYMSPASPISYRPLGRWDHPAPPAEPVFHLIHHNGDEEWLTDLLIAAATEGIPLHGAGSPEPGVGLELGSQHGFVVVRRGLSPDNLGAVVDWLSRQPEITVADRCR